MVVHGRDHDAAAAISDRIQGSRGRAISAICDLTDVEQIEAMRNHIEDELGPADIIVANAGGNPIRPGPIEQLTETEWHQSVEVNLTATFLTIKAFLPSMKERGRGNIITMSSAAARRPTVRSPAPYAAAKAGRC